MGVSQSKKLGIIPVHAPPWENDLDFDKMRMFDHKRPTISEVNSSPLILSLATYFGFEI